MKLLLNSENIIKFYFILYFSTNPHHFRHYLFGRNKCQIRRARRNEFLVIIYQIGQGEGLEFWGNWPSPFHLDRALRRKWIFPIDFCK